MIYQGKEIDDRFCILSPFFDWADARIALYSLWEGNVWADARRLQLNEAEVKLLEIVLQAERDADGNMAARREAGG